MQTVEIYPIDDCDRCRARHAEFSLVIDGFLCGLFCEYCAKVLVYEVEDSNQTERDTPSDVYS